ncbi:excreted virulence factor EspC (type VII ESX diderm) [Kitasatospora cineracea]|uniref:Excreted virulence factor EspC (Type VII ESX diderm) n=1 Tax=Kitasatospora cineracea TaxID=88074 RepID=A0A3N4RP49_9ACTN|nr:excreted virulence factor EspC (type VII ESX diderm) [Kitasatospora cineracea]
MVGDGVLSVGPGGSGGSGGGFQVEPGELDGAGQTAGNVAEQVPSSTSQVLGASDDAEAGLRGWTTGSELDSCTDEWKRLLDSLSAEMDRQGGNLRQTAANYRRAEQDVATGLAGR